MIQGLTAVADPRIGHDDVQSAQLLDSAVDGGFKRVVIADVDLGGHDPAVETLDQIRGLGEVIRSGCGDIVIAADALTHVNGDDVSALLRQPDRVTAPLAARGTSDESDLAFDSSSHEIPSSPLPRSEFD